MDGRAPLQARVQPAAPRRARRRSPCHILAQLGVYTVIASFCCATSPPLSRMPPRGGRLKATGGVVAGMALNGWLADKPSTQAQGVNAQPPGCQRFTNVCIDQSTFVFYDEKYSWESPDYEPVPQLERNVTRVQAHAQTTGVSNTDADPRPRLTLKHAYQARPRTALEGTPELQNPSFSNRTVPIVLYTEFMYNICEFMRFTMSHVADWATRGVVTDEVSYVLSTPGGQGLHAYHYATLGAYTKHAVTTLAEFSRRVVQGAAANHTAEGTMQQCFARAFVCLQKAPDAGRAAAVGQRVVQRWAAEIPRNPLGLDPDPRVLKVLIGVRTGGVRTLLNLQEILQECARTGPLGDFKRVDCVPHSFARVQPVTRKEFMRNIGVTQSVDVLVNVHGAEGANAFFGREGLVAVELRPCGFGTKLAKWADMYYPTMHRRSGYSTRFFAVNVEDPTACAPGEHEQRHLDGGPAFKANTYMRDRHLKLPPKAFMKVLAHVAGFVHKPVERFWTAEKAGQNYALFKNGALSWRAR